MKRSPHREANSGLKQGEGAAVAPICPDVPWDTWMREDPVAAVGYLEAADAEFKALKRLSYRLLGLKPGASVLDVGCGVGNDVRELIRLVGTRGQVIGIDYSKEMIGEARGRTDGAGSHTGFVVCQAHRMSFTDDAFDACRADCVLQHLDDPAGALREMVRVTKPGGSVQIVDRDWGLVAVDADSRAVTRTMLDLICAKIRNGWIGRQLPALFRDCGLRAVRVRTVPLTARNFRIADTLLDLTLVAGHAAEEGLVSAEEARAWLQELQARDKAGRFFAAWTMFLVTGKKASSR